MSNHYVVHLKLIQYVNYTLIKNKCKVEKEDIGANIEGIINSKFCGNISNKINNVTMDYNPCNEMSLKNNGINKQLGKQKDN